MYISKTPIRTSNLTLTLSVYFIYIYIYTDKHTHTHTHTYIISKLPTSFVVTILNYAYGSNHNIILYSCITYVPYFKKKLGSHNTILQKILKIPPFHACQEGATTRKMSLSGFLFKTERGYCIYQIANSEIQWIFLFTYFSYFHLCMCEGEYSTYP